VCDPQQPDQLGSEKIPLEVIGHHLFADDTHLFISFWAPELSANILHLQNTIDLVSQWLYANLLSLHQSKTEFLLIGLPDQLSL